MEKSRFTITELIITKPIKSLLKIKESDCISNINKGIKATGIINICKTNKKQHVYLVDDNHKIKLIGVPNFILPYIFGKQLIIIGILIVNDKRKNIMVYEDFIDQDNKALFQ